MEIIIGLAIVGFVFVSLILPWINRGNIALLERKAQRLEQTIARLKRGQQEEEYPPYADHQVELPFQQPTVSPPPSEPWPELQPEPRPERIKPQPAAPSAPPKPIVSFEEKFGAKLPVWIGGIALVLAAFFLVKYSIEIGLLTPRVRIILGIVFGFSLIQGGSWIHARPSIANEKKIGQSLCGAGIAVLYISIFTGTTIYDFIPPFVGFIGMTFVTALAVILSLRFGVPIAIMGLIGGFLTPALINTGNPSAPLLFGYLYLIFTGLMILARQKNWWFLAIPAMLLSFVWLVIWLMLEFSPADTVWLGLFILAVCGTCIASSEREFHPRRPYFDLAKMLNYAGITLGIALMATVSFCGEFGLMEWLLFGTLTVGGIALAYFKERLYGFVPLLTMLVNAVMFLVWPAFDAPNDTHFAITLLSFAGIYMTAGYMMLRRAQIPVLWGTLMGLTGVIYFLLAYWKVDTPDIHLFWGTIGLTLAAFCVYMVHEIQQKFRPCVTAQYLLAIFTIATVTFVSLALSIELKREYLSIAFASEIVVIAWLNTRLSIAALRPVAAILGCVFAMILLPQLWLMVQLAVYSITEMQLTPERIPPIVSYPWFQLGLPALMFIGSGYYLRAATASEAPRTWRSDVDKPDWLALSLETAAVALVGLMCYYITRNAMHAGENIFAVKPGFFERGLLTNIFFIYGLACIWVGRKFYRLSFSVSGFVLCGFALFRIIYFDMMIRNPLWNDEMVGSWPLLNALLLTYGLPIAWTSLTAQELRWFDKNQTLTQWIQGLRAFVLILLFVLVSLNVRQLFHGEFLEGVNTSNAEVYSYSAAWLLLGVGLLIAGIAKRSQMIRYASLGVLLLTVGKVFLYDASELEGLYRVFSFFGLGLCLIGMSYFYTRFVFVKTGRNDDR